MKLSHLRDVLAVAEFGGLRAAGRHLKIPQPVITRSIREIEHELGATLFERHARGTRLTDIGRVFLHRATIVDSELRRARDEVDQLKGGGKGQVSVVLSAASIMAIFPTVLSKFRDRYPDALLKVAEGLFQAVENEILDGSVDLYVGPFNRSNFFHQLAVEQIFNHRRVVAARKGHPLSQATSIADLAQARWIRPALSIRNSEADFEFVLRDMGIADPKIVMHTRSTLATLVAIMESDLLTVLPQQWLEFGVTANCITALGAIEPMAAAPVCIVRRRDLPSTPMAEYLADLMRRAGERYGRDGMAASRSKPDTKSEPEVHKNSPAGQTGRRGKGADDHAKAQG
ncbi:DNA-binding transcriptional LysR family regulator [Roseiarcus fermentans]|uniref:DNA-binding transcriptional LysR family regulator n=1 Tax=Roseiarcus fermentans TaxID=1473586 RepID=A0A366FBP9_9HYPH|nr:LysR substrate-binding domain-containing protein [Roseiarcus fermentans]RBP11380.1 DNA-binding transcriptional LysR family regulator [Roseiarcus fermentans]